MAEKLASIKKVGGGSVNNPIPSGKWVYGNGNIGDIDFNVNYNPGYRPFIFNAKDVSTVTNSDVYVIAIKSDGTVTSLGSGTHSTADYDLIFVYTTAAPQYAGSFRVN